MTPAKLDELLDALGGEWAEAVVRVNEFDQLFGNTVRVDLLNLVGGAFFADVQRILWDDVLLRVTRLTDPLQTSRKDNLTIRRLPELCERDKVLSETVQEQVDVAVHTAGSARKHRNQRISHRDLTYAIGSSELPTTSLGEIRRALDTVHAVLQTVNIALLGKYLSKVVSVGPRAEAFLLSTDSLVNAVLCVEELLADLNDRAPAWDESVASDCIKRLGGVPSPENVQRILDLRATARWLHSDAG